ncbi:MAG: hypothetical protein NTX25_16715 [Proteobacteria bacterium]|nr:hypothetical protein [Pseudomonadota bacterium]
MNQQRVWLLFGLLSMMASLSGCGQEKKHKSTPPPPLGTVTQVFADISAKYKLPRDILLAIAFKSSGFSSKASRGSYGIEALLRGMPAGETVMGLPRSLLKLDDNAESDSIRLQMEAYGAWVRSNLESQHLELSPSPNTPDAIYDWIWQLAKMHYADGQTRKNVQIIFVFEIINVLNKGFIWQDAVSRERIELPPRQSPLSKASFSTPIQANLQLDTQTSELFYVDYLQLTLGESTNTENQDKRILVIHCPFSLSICLGSQTVKSPSTSVTLNAHYVVASDESLLTRPIKILQHRTPVRVTDTKGEQQLLTDAIVIMLVGNSGRYIDGSRVQTDPTWYTRNQLKNMGKLIQGVCQLMNRDDPSIDIERCRTPGLGLEFRSPTDLGFRIGDIADFDPSIFWAFAKNPDNLSGEVDISLPANQKLFPAGAPIQTHLAFIRGTAKLEVQLLERCSSGKTVWSTLQTHYLRNTDSKNIELSLYDQGPNLNGQHFIRALAYAADGKLMGWTVKDLFLSNYDTLGTPGPNTELCLPRTN